LNSGCEPDVTGWNDFGRASEDRSDLETTISDLMTGQYDNPAREIMRRVGLAGDELPSSLEAFVDQHLGPDRQLTLRLA
jgi:hypothetical protein